MRFAVGGLPVDDAPTWQFRHLDAIPAERIVAVQVESARIEALEAGVVRAWQHEREDYTTCGVCGEGGYGMWLTPEKHKPSCIVPTIDAALPPDKRAALAAQLPAAKTGDTP